MRRRGATGSGDDHLVSLRTAVQGFIFPAKILLFQATIVFYAYTIKYT